MAISLVPYEAAHVPAVADFNRRLQEGGCAFQFYASPSTDWLPADLGAPVHRIYRLALDEDGLVRGGYALRMQEFVIGGERVRVGNYQLPLSEGIVDSRFRTLGTRLLRSALRESPLLYGLGMGGIEQPMPTLLRASGFDAALVPFFFKVLRARRFLLEMPALRRRSWLRLAVAGASYSGLGPGAIHGWQALRHRVPGTSDFRLERIASLEGDWLDGLMDRSVGSRDVMALRSAAVMSRVFPERTEANIKLRLLRGDDAVGYVVVRCTQMKADAYFGNLRLGSLVDGWCESEAGPVLVDLATRFLKEAGADLVISNQTHRLWQNALQANGYLSYQSNFGLVVSPKLIKAMGGEGLGARLGDCHFNRSDGDGPIHI